MADFHRAVADIETIGNGIATAQTMARAAFRRRSETPLARLKRTGKLSVWEEGAADEIVKAHAISQGQSVNERGTDERRCPSSPDAGAVHRIDAVDKYQDWRADLARTPALYVTVTVLFEDVGFRALDRSNKWPDGTAFELFVEGLRHFAALRGNTPRGVKWRYVPT